MKAYLVGGAVRDELLNLPVKDRDWVVVGATVEEMLKKGFRQVGKDFPVFLNPKTNEEYALARTERKVGRGYVGFDFNASASVTLEEDLLRRDLTINAIAKTPDGVLIDPYHGKEDIKNKLLRHVSPAFVEDPVRVLRVARFAARFAELGFTIAPETILLMKEMVAADEVSALVAERVWKELERALQEKNPEEFFQALSQCGALGVLFPQIKMEGVGMAALKLSSRCFPDAEIRFAVLVHDLSIDQLKELCDRYRVPSSYRELSLLVAKYCADYLRANQLDAGQLLALLQAADGFRRVERFQKFLNACFVIASAMSKPSQSEWLLDVYKTADAINIKELLSNNLVGKEIADLIYQKRLAAVVELINKKRPNSL